MAVRRSSGVGVPEVNPDRLKSLLKQPKGYDPSKELDDIHLAPGEYLLEGNIVRQGTEAETEGGLYVPLGKDMIPPNMGKVLKRAEGGCKVPVGWYVLMPAYGGNYHDDKKPHPIIRRLGDEEILWIIHDDNVRLWIPPAKEEEDGTDAE